MPLPSALALGLTLFTLFWFLLIAVRKRDYIRDLEDFLFYGRTLDGKGYTRTFVATGISLATVLTFFLDFGGQFGFALLVSPVAYLIGVYLLLRALPALQSEGYLEKGSTLHAFIGRSFQSDALRKATAVVSLLGYIGILVIELHVGVHVFQAIYSGKASLIATVILLLTVIFLYTWLAGYQAVVDTDKIQLAFIGVATVLGLGFLAYAASASSSPFPRELLNPNPLQLPLSLLVVMIVGNIPLQILRMSNWQRIAAAGKPDAVRQGLIGGIVWTFIFWLAFNVMGILLRAATPEAEGLGAVRLLQLLESHGGPIALVAFPLLFVGLVAALVSTADSIFVPILTAWVYDFRRYKELHDDAGWARDVSPQFLTENLKLARGSIKYFLLITVVMYVILAGYARFDFVSLLFVFFNQQLVLFPAVICSLASSTPHLTKASRPLFVGTIAGWLTVWGVTVTGTLREEQSLVFHAATVGLVVAIAIPLAVSRVARAAFARGFMRIMKGV